MARITKLRQLVKGEIKLKPKEGLVVRLLPSRLRRVRNLKLPREEGIKPVNWFVSSSTIVNLEELEIQSGIFPVILFAAKEMFTRFGRL